MLQSLQFNVSVFAITKLAVYPIFNAFFQSRNRQNCECHTGHKKKWVVHNVYKGEVVMFVSFSCQFNVKIFSLPKLKDARLLLSHEDMLIKARHAILDWFSHALHKYFSERVNPSVIQIEVCISMTYFHNEFYYKSRSYEETRLQCARYLVFICI